jgi:hypothetical protein
MKTENKVRKGEKGQTRAAKMYWRAAQKGARKVDGQKDSITDISDAELAALAWQINPDLCKKNLVAAIKQTIQTLLDTREARRRALADLVAEELRAAFERDKNERDRLLDHFRTKGHDDYYRVVKFITGEKNWDRALNKIKRFETARGATTGNALEKVLAVYRNKIFTGTKLMQLWGEHRQWWAQEKSKLAKKAGQARKGGQGRVKRRESDLRFTESRRHKQGYCRNCGKRVRTRERLCDDCVSGKPLLDYWGDLDDLRAIAGHTGYGNIVGRY